MKYSISQLFVYPIKSLPGIALQQATLSPEGIAWDRYWMLTHPDGQFITQREIPALVFFEIKLEEEGIRLNHPKASQALFIPFLRAEEGKSIQVYLFGQAISAAIEKAEINDWFSTLLGKLVYLTYIPKDKGRTVKNHPDAPIHFPDSSPYLVLGEEALHFLNNKLEEPVGIERFRPNIVFSGGGAHDEDQWQSVEIGDQHFETVKSCARCNLTTIDPVSGIVGKEPLHTLATYRRQDKKVLFGRYLKPMNQNHTTLRLGDEIIVKD